MTRNFYLPLCLAALFGAAANASAADMVAFSLADTEKQALAFSPSLKSAEAELAAAQAAVKAQRSATLPRVMLEGNAKYSTRVAKINNMQLGDNWNYSLGPSVYWTAFDKGSLRFALESAEHTAAARAEDAENVRRQVLFAARSAYFQLQLSLAQVQLIGDQLKLSSDQYRDIALNVRAGTKSRLDELMAHQDVLARLRELRSARNSLSAAVRDLASLTGQELRFDPSLGLDARMTDSTYTGAEPASVYIAADSSSDLFSRMGGYAASAPDLSAPSLRALEQLAASYKSMSAVYNSDKWPKLQLSARTSLDYPNGPSLYSFNQNSAGITLSVPLFEGGKNDARSLEAQNKAQSADEKRADLARSITRDFLKARDHYNALAAQQGINTRFAAEAQEAASLTYASYKAGRSTYLEVQSANLRVLSARTILANTDAQMLIDLALLASLGK